MWGCIVIGHIVDVAAEWESKGEGPTQLLGSSRQGLYAFIHRRIHA